MPRPKKIDAEITNSTAKARRSPAKPTVQAKRPVGRPSMYRPEYCELAIEIGRKGGGPLLIAAEIGVLRENLYDWAKVHPEFSTALRKAKELEQIWWENKGLEGLNAERFNAQVWKISMQARFREDYTEKKITEVTGKDGGAIQTESRATIDASKMTQEERDILRTALLAAKARLAP